MTTSCIVLWDTLYSLGQLVDGHGRVVTDFVGGWLDEPTGFYYARSPRSWTPQGSNFVLNSFFKPRDKRLVHTKGLSDVAVRLFLFEKCNNSTSLALHVHGAVYLESVRKLFTFS